MELPIKWVNLKMCLLFFLTLSGITIHLNDKTKNIMRTICSIALLSNVKLAMDSDLLASKGRQHCHWYAKYLRRPMYGKKLCSWYHTDFLPLSSAAESIPRMASGNSKEGEGWKQVPTGTKRKAPVTPEHLQLLNRFTTLKAEEDLDLLSSRAPWPT